MPDQQMVDQPLRVDALHEIGGSPCLLDRVDGVRPCQHREPQNLDIGEVCVNACGRLDALERDVLSTKAAIRTALDALAARHNIPAKDITYAVENYVDDMLSDAIHNVEHKLEREILEDEDQGFLSSSP